jgi:hypothetical protein
VVLVDQKKAALLGCRDQTVAHIADARGGEDESMRFALIVIEAALRELHGTKATTQYRQPQRSHHGPACAQLRSSSWGLAHPLSQAEMSESTRHAKLQRPESGV